MRLRNLLLGWPVSECPVCGGSPRRHLLRTLARERFTPLRRGVESAVERGDFAAAAALDELVLGDQLVHQLVRCGDLVALITSEDPVGLGREARVRRTTILDGAAADEAWRNAR